MNNELSACREFHGIAFMLPTFRRSRYTEPKDQGGNEPKRKDSTGDPTKPSAAKVANAGSDAANTERTGKQRSSVAVCQREPVRDKQRAKDQKDRRDDCNDRHLNSVEPVKDSHLCVRGLGHAAHQKDYRRGSVTAKIRVI